MIRVPVRLLLALPALGACAGRPAETAPAPACAGGPCGWASLRQAVDSAVADSAAPGIVLAVSQGGRRFVYATGRLSWAGQEPVAPTSVYDLASLTKVVALTTLTMMAVDDGLIGLDDRVDRYLPAFTGPAKSAVTIRHLLTHSSGLPAHRPLWQETDSRDAALALVLATAIDTTPGARAVYSDLGAITLGQVVEAVYGKGLANLAERRIFRPLGMRSTRYRPPRSWLARVAPTENDPWRGRMVHGEVHDENAAFLGGVSGHAGLFSTALDLLRFGEWLLGRQAGRAGPGPALRSPTAREFTRRQDLVPGSSRALGWDTPSANSSAGNRLGPNSFGHTGFTGTSIWIDPDRELVVALLANRVHPTRENRRLLTLRGVLADRVVAVLQGEVR